jgi:hypothetical protein
MASPAAKKTPDSCSWPGHENPQQSVRRHPQTHPEKKVTTTHQQVVASSNKNAPSCQRKTNAVA